jgi:hypothetical protein
MTGHSFFGLKTMFLMRYNNPGADAAAACAPGPGVAAETTAALAAAASG